MCAILGADAHRWCTLARAQEPEEAEDEEMEEDLPCFRHWKKLSSEQKDFAQTLDYDEGSWFFNEPRMVTWKGLTMQPRKLRAAIALGFTVDTWLVDPEVDFEENAADTSTFVPRLVPPKTLAAVMFLLNNHADEWRDPTGARIWWEAWAACVPNKVEEVVDKPTWEWPSTLNLQCPAPFACSFLCVCVCVPAEGCKHNARDLPAELRTAATQFNETVEYKNVINACGLGAAQLRQNMQDHGEQTGKYIPHRRGDFLWVAAPDAEGTNVRCCASTVRTDVAT